MEIIHSTMKQWFVVGKHGMVGDRVSDWGIALNLAHSTIQQLSDLEERSSWKSRMWLFPKSVLPADHEAEPR